MSFATRLRELREKKGLSQVELSEALGLSKGAVNNYENGVSSPREETLYKIFEILECDANYLFQDDVPLTVPSLYPIETQSFPLLGSVACGEPIFADEELELYVQAGTNIKADFCLRAKGDSMTGARIYDGDIVFVRRQPTVENGEIAVVLIEDEATLKRVHYDQEAGVLLLFPENPNYKTMRYSGEELNRIRILGKAIGFQGDVK